MARQGGLSSIHWQNFDRSQRRLEAEFPLRSLHASSARHGAAAWNRARAPTASTTTAPLAGTPDSLFVPQFAPDEPGPRSSGSYSYKFTLSGKTTTYSYPNSYADDTVGTCTTTEKTPDKTTVDKWAGSEQKRLCKYKGKPAINTSSARGPNYNCDAMALTRKTKSESVLYHLHRQDGRGRKHRPSRRLHLGMAHDLAECFRSATASPTASQTTTRSSSS